MGDYNTYIERDTFNEVIYESIKEVLDEDSSINDLFLAIKKEDFEISIGQEIEFDDKWDTYPLENFVRQSSENNSLEVDIDSTFEIASSYFFVK
jgi:hypothetical protein